MPGRLDVISSDENNQKLLLLATRWRGQAQNIQWRLVQAEVKSGEDHTAHA